jgi:hypothetical protein
LGQKVWANALMISTDRLRLLRLKQGTRYVIALHDRNGSIHPMPFWTEAQALSYAEVPHIRWASVPTEILTAVFNEGTPAEATFFASRSRGGDVRAVVIWAKNGIFPAIYPCISEAKAAFSLAMGD